MLMASSFLNLNVITTLSCGRSGATQRLVAQALNRQRLSKKELQICMRSAHANLFAFMNCNQWGFPRNGDWGLSEARGGHAPLVVGGQQSRPKPQTLAGKAQTGALGVSRRRHPSSMRSDAPHRPPPPHCHQAFANNHYFWNFVRAGAINSILLNLDINRAESNAPLALLHSLRTW